MSKVVKVDTFVLAVPRDEPYLGSLRPGETINSRGYFVRNGNRTVYPTVDRSVLVRVETKCGAVGWGETYGLVAPKATVEIVEDLLADFVIGRDPADAETIHDDLYNLMRVRGYIGGFYLDALAAVDIALWDAAGRIAGKSISELLGGRCHYDVPGYVSGLPKPTLEERVAFAQEWMAEGFDSFKFAAPVADDGVVEEISQLRAGLGSDARIACDMHWANAPMTAIDAITQMEEYGLWFAEAPVAPEDIHGLAEVSRAVKAPVAAGEEWRTVFDAQLRFREKAVKIVQPEMGHTGITQFMRISKMAYERGVVVLPHATIGSGIFLAASLQASFALEGVVGHEFQHSIFNRNHNLITEGMTCADGSYKLSEGVGLGIEPTGEMLSLLER